MGRGWLKRGEGIPFNTSVPPKDIGGWVFTLKAIGSTKLQSSKGSLNEFPL